jgi:hypothetical protein
MSWICHVPETFGLTLEVGTKDIWPYLVRHLDTGGFYERIRQGAIGGTGNDGFMAVDGG